MSDSDVENRYKKRVFRLVLHSESAGVRLNGSFCYRERMPFFLSDEVLLGLDQTRNIVREEMMGLHSSDKSDRETTAQRCLAKSSPKWAREAGQRCLSKLVCDISMNEIEKVFSE